MFTLRNVIKTSKNCFNSPVTQLDVSSLVSSKLRSIHSSVFLRKRRKTAEERKSNVKPLEYALKSKLPIVQVWRCITPKQLAGILQKDVNHVRDLFLDKINSVNEPVDDMKLLQQVLKRSGHRMEIIANPALNDSAEIIDKDVYPRPAPSKNLLKPRPPVVTIMGHVDHGKTTLLDALRSSRVVDQEFGGITQHIGAFSVLLPTGARVTFLDTPGHAAFTTMRARGAQITDIVVLVVAADDGVMEQTIESIKMAKRAKVPILVAINKIDSGKADVERTKKMLLDVGLQVEDYGGDVQTVPVSALKKLNLEMLVEALVLQAEVLEIRADYTGPVEGVIVESKVDPARGKLSTMIVKRGTLRKGCVLVAGTAYAKVRTMRNESLEHLPDVTPGYPVEVEGWRELPSPGDVVLEVDTERKAKDVIKTREEKQTTLKNVEIKQAIMQKIEEHQKEYTEKLRMKRKIGRFKIRQTGPRKPEYEKDENLSLNVLIKGDVDGSVEAILDTLDTYEDGRIELNLINSGVGNVTESDLELAKIFNGVIYAFNIEIPKKLSEQAENLQVPLKKFNVIYKMIDDVKEELNARLPHVELEEMCGEATVLQQFEITQGRKKIPTAGCRVTKGCLKKTNALFKLVRNGEIIHEGQVSSLRHVKNEVETIKTNMECGIQFSDKTVAFEPGDTLQCFEKVTKPQEINWDVGF